jgi:hypothetical protein
VRGSLVAASLVAGVAGSVLASAAGAASEMSLLIRPGQAIGKIRLSMTEAELRRAMGRPRVAIRRDAGFGRGTVEYEFGFGDYGVRLFGAPGRLRVVRVSTLLRRERTSKGIGPGSLERNLIRAYPDLRCPRLATTVAAGTTYVTADERTCTLFAGSGRRTVFVTGVWRSATLISLRDWARRARVLEVSVGAST